MSPNLSLDLAGLRVGAERVPELLRLARYFTRELASPSPTSATSRVLALHRACLEMTRAHGMTIDVRGSFPGEPCVFVANHLGYLDPLVLCSLVPCAPIAKREVRDWPLIGTLAERYGALFVRRNHPHSGAVALRQALRLLERGVSVLNFPEGTTTNGRLRPFQRGVFGLAQLAQVPIVPITVWFDERRWCWVDDELLLPHYLRLLQSNSFHINVELGAALEPGQHDAAEMAQRVRASMQQRLDEVWPEVPSELHRGTHCNVEGRGPPIFRRVPTSRRPR